MTPTTDLRPPISDLRPPTSDTPLVSVCLPNLNTRPFLDERMASILGQTLRDWELIISDNYSDDGSWEFFQTFADDPRVRLSQAPRKGMYANWNECLRKARGEYVYIATSDDSSRPELLEKTVGALERFPDVDLVVFRHDETDVHGKIIGSSEEPEIAEFYGEWLDRPHRRNGKAEFLANMCIGCHWLTITAVVFRRRLLEKTGLFRTDCLSCADVPWRIKAALNSDVLYLPDRLATWRRHDAQATANLPLSREALLFRIIREAVAECDSLIPEAWKGPSDYRDRILFQRRRRYLMEYHLHRTAMRGRTADFLKGCARAVTHEPRFLLERLLSGFTWDSPLYGDRVAYLRELIREWRVSWPPESI